MFRLFSVFTWLAVAGMASASDWTHWRGPNQNGSVEVTGLPDSWEPTTVGKDNLIWKQPYGTRSTPMVMNGRVYLFGAHNETLDVPTQKEKLLIAEHVICFDAESGKKIWEKPFNVYHTDIVVTRLGWSPIAGDRQNDLVYVHGTAGELFCFNGKTGDIVWERQLTEEFGRVTGYGGRIGGGPVFDSGLVFVGIVNSSWGNHAVATNRFFAFDGKTGAVVWISETPAQGVKGTYYSNPVVAVINGERLLISGGADGGIHAFQVRTGKRVWSYIFSAGIINPSPVVDGNFIWISHGEENPTGSDIGKLICLDGSQVQNGKPKLVWEVSKGMRWGLASMAYADGKLYVPDDGAKLFCFDAKNGKELWKYNYGTTSRGAPLIADGKIYLSETVSKFHIIKLKEGKERPDPDETYTVNFKNRPGGKGFVESNCTPSIGKGVMYIASRDELYCIGTGKGTEPKGKPIPEETKGDSKVAQVALYPAEVSAKAGEKLKFEVRLFNAAGQPLPVPPTLLAEWSLPTPPVPKGGTTAPPPLDAVVDAKTGEVSIDAKKPSQQGYVAVKVDGIEGRSRVRVVPQVPYKQDFEKVPVGAVPGGWVNTQGKFKVVEETENGKTNKFLFKVNNDSRPPIARANAYITGPWTANCTIEADLRGIEAKSQFPDMGLVNARYTLLFDGKTDESGNREIRLASWEALPRINEHVPFTWKSNVWYHAKLSVEVGDKEALIRGKIWPRDEKEPEKWTIQFKDPMPNRVGATAVYGYVSNALADSPGGEIHYDNIAITPNGK